MKRVLEKEVMSSKKEARAFDAASKLFGSKSKSYDVLIKELKKLHKSKLEILDIGCGPAVMDIRIAKSNRSWRITGIELSDEMIRFARKNIAKENVGKQVKIEKRDAKNTKLPSKSFDVVISNNTVHQLKNPVPLLKECIRLVKPTGRIIIKDVTRTSEKELADVLRERKVIFKEVVKATEKMVKESFKAGFTVEEIRFALNKLKVKKYTIKKGKRFKGMLPYYMLKIPQ